MLAHHETKNTRERVLHNLLVRDRCTINELAEAVQINPISVRHHIMKLEAEGYVDSEEERHGVGRPRRSYFLTEQGREQFPTRYIRLTLRLLEQLKEQATPAFIHALFTQMAEDLASSYLSDIKGLTFDQRLEFVSQLLEKEGFSVEVEKQKDRYIIRETTCPYFHIGQNHPEVCSLDQTLITTLMEVPTEKVQCLLHGDSYCKYIIHNGDRQESESAPLETEISG